MRKVSFNYWKDKFIKCIFSPSLYNTPPCKNRHNYRHSRYCRIDTSILAEIGFPRCRLSSFKTLIALSPLVCSQ